MTAGPKSARPGRTHGATGNSTAMSWLGHDARAAGVLATVRLHILIQQALIAVLPIPLATACRVLALDNQRLQLGVPTPAHAAKLRQMGPTMRRGLSEHGFQIADIEVKVQASLQRLNAPTVRAPKETVPLNEPALSSFETLHRTLKPGPLADAVARLLAHHRAD